MKCVKYIVLLALIPMLASCAYEAGYVAGKVSHPQTIHVPYV